MFKTVNALVLREVRYKEADRILTLLTDTDGKITVKARGALRKSSKTAAATQQLTYSEMTLFGNLGRWTVNEATVKEGFDGLRADIGSFALGCYFAECADALSVEDQPDAPLMQSHLKILDDLAESASTSMQRDIEAGKDSEVDGLIYQVVRLSDQYGLPSPEYRKIAKAVAAELAAK